MLNKQYFYSISFNKQLKLGDSNDIKIDAINSTFI